MLLYAVEIYFSVTSQQSNNTSQTEPEHMMKQFCTTSSFPKKAPIQAPTTWTLFCLQTFINNIWVE